MGVGALFEKAHNKKRISYFRRTHAIRTMTTKQQQKTQTMGYTKYQQLQRMSHPNMMISRAKLLLNNPKHRRTANSLQGKQSRRKKFELVVFGDNITKRRSILHSKVWQMISIELFSRGCQGARSIRTDANFQRK